MAVTQTVPADNMDIFYPIQLFADLITYTLLRLGESSYIGSAVNFFIFDSIKIGILLVVINYGMAVMRYYFPIDKLKSILAKRKWYGLEYLVAALLGAVTPFCSCSSIPLFIGFLGAGIPLGVTFTFLIASPLINESSLVLFPALFGLKTTIVYNVMGMAVSVVGGVLLQRLHLEKYVNQDLLHLGSRAKSELTDDTEHVPLRKLLRYFWKDGWAITRTIFPYVLLGVGVGALIHGFVPTELIEKYLSIKQWWVVPLATILGVPLYANSVSVLPIAEALVEKGVPLGTALAFMTATVTLSIPEALMLKKVMKLPLLAAFFGITIMGIILMGLVFNVWL